VPRGQHTDTSPLVRSINQRTAELTKIPLPVVSDGSIQVARYVSGSFMRAALIPSRRDAAVCLPAVDTSDHRARSDTTTHTLTQTRFFSLEQNSCLRAPQAMAEVLDFRTRHDTSRYSFS
jgi:hypothetical protein